MNIDEIVRNMRDDDMEYPDYSSRLREEFDAYIRSLVEQVVRQVVVEMLNEEARDE